MPKALITIGMNVTFMFHSFFDSLTKLRYLSLFLHSFNFILWSAGTSKSTILQVFFFFFFCCCCCLLIICLVFWPGLGYWFLYQSPIGFYVCHSLGQILGCAYTICSYSQISISCISPSGSFCPPSCIKSHTSFVLIGCIRLLNDRSLCLYHHITYIYYFVSSNLFSLWYNYFLWFCFVLLLRYTLFFFLGFFFLAMTTIFVWDVAY